MKLTAKIIIGDCLEKLKELPDDSVNCCVTSPPYYGLRDYGTASWIGGDSNCDHKGKPFSTKASLDANCGNKQRDKLDNEFFKEFCGKCGAKRIDQQIGLEKTPEKYVEKLVQVFREVRRVLKSTGTVWLNLGSSYISNKMESDDMVLRDDLTNEEKKLIIAGVLKYVEEKF
jgi:site-specific DNA-methyltransferase (cytosine-N4-specific)